MRYSYCLLILFLVPSYNDSQQIKLSKKNRAHKSMLKFSERDGYPLEGHIVTTEDNYLLTTYRIPHGKNVSTGDKIPILITHGILGCSENFVVYRNKSFAFYFADKGYDVWLLNSRGNRHSRRHKYLNPDEDKQFWDFSLQEVAIYDVPNNIDYILNHTKQEKLILVGYSQGTTITFITLIERPEYNNKLLASVHLSPAVFRTHLKDTFPVLHSVIQMYRVAEEVLYSLNIYEMLPNNDQITYLFWLLSKVPPLKPIFLQVLHLMGGISSTIFDQSVLEDVMKIIPAGSSTKEIIHSFQQMATANFSQYDYGAEENLKVYNSTDAPKYDITKVTAPVILMYAKYDWLTQNEVEDLKKALPHIYKAYQIPYERFGHLDFMFAKNVVSLVLEPLYHIFKTLK